MVNGGYLHICTLLASGNITQNLNSCMLSATTKRRQRSILLKKYDPEKPYLILCNLQLFKQVSNISP